MPSPDYSDVTAAPMSRHCVRCCLLMLSGESCDAVDQIPLCAEVDTRNTLNRRASHQLVEVEYPESGTSCALVSLTMRIVRRTAMIQLEHRTRAVASVLHDIR